MKYLLFLLLSPAFAFAQPTLLQPTDFASPNKSGSATLDFPSTASGGYSELTMSVVGAADKDAVLLGVETAAVPSVSGSYFAWASATDTITIRFCNHSGAAVNPASGVFTVFVIRF